MHKLTSQHLLEFSSIDSKFFAVSILVMAIELNTRRLAISLFDDCCQMVDHFLLTNARRLSASANIIGFSLPSQSDARHVSLKNII